MPKSLKRVLQILGVLLVILIISGVLGWFWVKANFLNFEKEYAEQTQFEKHVDNGYRFLDRNGNERLDPYEDSRLPIDERVTNLLSLMTMEEKIHLLKGSGLASGLGMLPEGEGIPGAVGTIVATPRLGLPTIYLSDGPAGLRIEPKRKGEERSYYATSFPIASLLSSTWNSELVEQVGQAMGNEAKSYGIDVILGPGANIHRHPLTGRNFEYFSEDPYLSGIMSASIINGIESNNVGTSIKHFVANNQETNRNINDSRLSQRALREIYLKGFQIAVEQAQPWTIMSSYNRVNGVYASENSFLLTEVLRDDWGFKGLVMTDWFGGQDAIAQIKSGNDLLEPGTRKQWEALLDGYEDGKLTKADIDQAAGRVLRLVIGSNKMLDYQYDNDPDLKAHAIITRQSAAEGIILLKNDKATLPLKGQKNVALLGTTSYDFLAGGTGSGDVNEAYTISLEQGLLNVGDEVRNNNSAQLTMEEGQQQVNFQINAYARSLFESFKEENEEAFIKPEGLSAMTNPYTPPQLTYSRDQLQQIAQTADLAIITIGRNAGEGGDRVEKDDFLLFDSEREMIEQTSAVFHAQGKQVVVVLNIGGVIETASWKHQPDAIVLAWQGGQEGGNSVADILAGYVNPSGKLPMTFPVKLDDHLSNKNFPLDGEPIDFLKLLIEKPKEEGEELVKNKDFTVYEEGIYVGYRHFDKSDLAVSYPFGFGLSYTRFELNGLKVKLENDSILIDVHVMNSGEIAGKEVVQVYSALPKTNIDRPTQELRTFAKTKSLMPNESQVISLKIPLKDLAFWNELKNAWEVEPGVYEMRVGNSSRNISLTSSLLIE